MSAAQTAADRGEPGAHADAEIYSPATPREPMSIENYVREIEQALERGREGVLELLEGAIEILYTKSLYDGKEEVIKYTIVLTVGGPDVRLDVEPGILTLHYAYPGENETRTIRDPENVFWDTLKEILGV